MTEVKRRLRTLRHLLREASHSLSISVCVLSVVLSAVIFFVSTQMKTVYVKDGSDSILKYTFKREPADILNAMQISTRPYDDVDFSGFYGKLGLINITRAFPVTIEVDGKLMAAMTPDVTVDELLKQQGIELGEFDEINISPLRYTTPNMRIKIKRVELMTTVVSESIPYSVEYKENCLLRRGRTRTLISGIPGERTVTYVDRVVDGVLHAREKSGAAVVREPVTQLVLRGTSDPVSDLDFGVPLNANGVPTSYKRVLYNQICTGYSAGRGAYGASGMDLFDGYVAVRADEIPYGTKMYITSADGSFVYGFAIAADTGVGLMQNIIDFDLFYETYVESALNGRKYLNVYIL